MLALTRKFEVGRIPSYFWKLILQPLPDVFGIIVRALCNGLNCIQDAGPWWVLCSRTDVMHGAFVQCGKIRQARHEVWYSFLLLSLSERRHVIFFRRILSLEVYERTQERDHIKICWASSP